MQLFWVQTDSTAVSYTRKCGILRPKHGRELSREISACDHPSVGERGIMRLVVWLSFVLASLLACDASD